VSTLVIGDVHGCADELLELLERTGPDRVILVGDLFTKGPDPVGVWSLICSHGLEAVLGNHDAHVLNRWGNTENEVGWGGLPERARLWLKALPLILEEDGFVVVHGGLHPTEGVAGTTREMALDLRRWPLGSVDEKDPFWWSAYQGEGLVMYGHDAIRGLVDRRPITLGLDTGCVYGRSLSGYLVEADRLVTVRARRVYRSVAVTSN
jgi:predicted phosphodiesterase